MLDELMDLVARSKVKGLKLTITVDTHANIHSHLEDAKGQRGSGVSGVLHGDMGDFDSLDGQAKFLVLQEAATALKAQRE